MIETGSSAAKIAGHLLQIKAVKLQPQDPFVWASGWHSPIYCDNRQTLSYPSIRNAIRQAFVDAIRLHYPNTEVIAGVATGGIGIGALVADALDLPFVYVRSSSKKHGMQNQIEGRLLPHQKTVVIEDLVSTGKSSLLAVESLRQAGATIEGMVAIFTYGFDKADRDFAAANCRLITLTDYECLLNEAIRTDYINTKYLETLKNWRNDPANWNR